MRHTVAVKDFKSQFQVKRAKAPKSKERETYVSMILVAFAIAVRGIFTRGKGILATIGLMRAFVADTKGFWIIALFGSARDRGKDPRCLASVVDPTVKSLINQVAEFAVPMGIGCLSGNGDKGYMGVGASAWTYVRKKLGITQSDQAPNIGAPLGYNMGGARKEEYVEGLTHVSPDHPSFVTRTPSLKGLFMEILVNLIAAGGWGTDEEIARIGLDRYQSRYVALTAYKHLDPECCPVDILLDQRMPDGTWFFEPLIAGWITKLWAGMIDVEKLEWTYVLRVATRPEILKMKNAGREQFRPELEAMIVYCETVEEGAKFVLAHAQRVYTARQAYFEKKLAA